MFWLDRDQEALGHVDAALVLDPQTAGHHSRRAQILIDMGRPADASFSSALKPLASHHFRYMRNSISAQSCASVPPLPA